MAIAKDFHIFRVNIFTQTLQDLGDNMKDDFYGRFKTREECVRNGGEWVRPYWRGNTKVNGYCRTTVDDEGNYVHLNR